MSWITRMLCRHEYGWINTIYHVKAGTGTMLAVDEFVVMLRHCCKKCNKEKDSNNKRKNEMSWITRMLCRHEYSTSPLYYVGEGGFYFSVECKKCLKKKYEKIN